MLVYSFLTPGQYGNVEWDLLAGRLDRASCGPRDIFDGTLELADAHLTIFWRSVWLSVLTTVITFLRRLSDRLVHRHAPAARRARSGCS